MERRSRLAVFEHVSHKDSPIKQEFRICKRERSSDSYSNQISKKSNSNNGIKWLLLTCKFNDCDFETKDYNVLLKHVDEHCDSYSSVNGEFYCLWNECEFVTENMIPLKQHLKYHAYHLKLMCIGLSAAKKLRLPKCNEAQKFCIPKLPAYYSCDWDSCDLSFYEYQDFINHVNCHVNASPKKTTNTEEVKCEWIGCTSVFPQQYRLSEHVRSHTKEKVLACPACRNMFAAKSKFIDHCRNQTPDELKSYQCSQCFKLFASERLLRNHMRTHVNHYKCHLCDMTCITPSILAKHIRYRHLTERPFKCDICSHSTVMLKDLKAHRETHIMESKYHCDCGFKCRTKYAINQHIKTIHQNDWEYKYECHCCGDAFRRGGLLTKHLIKVHDFQWPSGHSRFLYKQDIKTGKFSLTIMRYESLEVTQEMMKESPFPLANADNLKFDCVQNKDNPLFFMINIAKKDSDEDKQIPNIIEPKLETKCEKYENLDIIE